MKFILTIFLVFCSSIYGNTQSNAVKWSKLERRQGAVIDLLPIENDGFYALRWTGSRLLGHYQVSKHENLLATKKAKISTSTDFGIANFEAARVIGNKFVVFLSDKRDGKNFLIMREYSEDLVPKQGTIELANYDLGKGRSKGYFDVILSPNGKYFGVIWEIPGKKSGKDIYGFKIYDNELNLINDGEYPLPFAAELSMIHSHFISNQGEYFLALTEYREGEKKVFGNQIEFKALHIYHIASDGLLDFVLDLNGRRVETMAMSTFENDVFMITGIYGEQDKQGVSGVFYQRINLKNQEVQDEGFQEFDQEFITQDWTEKQKERAERREEKGKGEPQLYNYQMREITTLEDGSIVGTMEQYYVQVRSYMDSRTGQTNYTYYYYYNDIIAYKIGKSGDFDWIQKIRKYQVSVNDGGPYSSYSSYVDDGKIYFLFNDSAKNYDEKGEFTDPERLNSATYTKRNNAVCIASIDLETGEVFRKNFFDVKEINALAVPKLFEVNYKLGEVLMYSIWGNKEKFGLLKFENN